MFEVRRQVCHSEFDRFLALEGTNWFVFLDCPSVSTTSNQPLSGTWKQLPESTYAVRRRLEVFAPLDQQKRFAAFQDTVLGAIEELYLEILKKHRILQMTKSHHLSEHMLPKNSTPTQRRALLKIWLFRVSSGYAGAAARLARCKTASCTARF